MVSPGVSAGLADVRQRIAAVPDPELPMLSIADLGILRTIEEVDGTIEVVITPTYAGCPAMEAIRADIEAAAEPARVVVRTVLAPPWSSDDITEAGRRALAAHGIAPPGPAAPVGLTLAVRCPQCGSVETRELSRFAAAACRSLRVCTTCAEPFDAFKAH
ncbi:MAG: paaD [Marmoricola sp.]|nr:paaD [Marmoricola sp.]